MMIPVNDPLGLFGTDPLRVNDKDEMGGEFESFPDGRNFYGFLATPTVTAEPSAFIPLFAGIFAVAGTVAT